MTWRSFRRVLIGGNKRNICGLEAFPAGTPECVVVPVINWRVTATSRRANSFLFCCRETLCSFIFRGKYHTASVMGQLTVLAQKESKLPTVASLFLFFVHIFLSAKHLMV